MAIDINSTLKIKSLSTTNNISSVYQITVTWKKIFKFFVTNLTNIKNIHLMEVVGRGSETQL